MKLLIAGLGGTLGPKLAQAARSGGHEVVGWDRARLDLEDESAIREWLEREQPQGIAHLALGPVDWVRSLARYAAHSEIPFLLTSTAMVFHHEPGGPHAPGDLRDARDDYGRYKIECEDAAMGAHPHATVARIGWQIDPDGLGNNMLAQLDRWHREQGEVAASRAWRPACSFMADTAQALLRLLERPQPGAWHLDSNAVCALTFDEIVAALACRFNRNWRIRVHGDYRHDQRLVGHEVLMPVLAERLT